MRKFRSTFRVAPSKIHGLGCFTTIDLEPGMSFPVPYHYTGEGEADEYSVYVEEEGFVEPCGPFRCLNHKDNPRATFYWDDEYGLMIQILRLTKAGKEITIEYEGEEW